ncbi:major facilitator superfamily MFS_1 [Pseudomonas chlororaphis subsp. aurantiaca]|nr:major facilitator superfamily MFS_1 [Pseudomonas chlororaphis subsp. aurantiaca]
MLRPFGMYAACGSGYRVLCGLKAKKAPEEGAKESPEPREPGEPVRRGVAVVRRD